MAVSYLDKTGLSYFWGKVKGIVSPKADKSEMSVTPGTGADADKTTIQLKSGTSATVLKTHQDISGKADKDTDAVEGHLAKFDGSGNPVDGGDTADYAKNLVAPVVQSDAEFVFRKTGGSLAVDGAGGAVLQKIKGKTLAWNQYVASVMAIGSIEEPEKWSTFDSSTTISLSDNTITATKSGGYGICRYFFGSNVIISGHKYFMSAKIKTEAPANQIRIAAYGVDTDIDGSRAANVSNSGWQQIMAIRGCQNARNQEIRIINDENSDFHTFQFKYVQFIDLTLMFGAGNEPSTVAEFEAMFPLPYYDYNPGTLINNDAEGIETVGFNLWDGQVEKGGINNVTGENISENSSFRTKNYISVFPSTEYSLTPGGMDGAFFVNEYGINKTFLRQRSAQLYTSPIFTTSADACYMRINFYKQGSGWGSTDLPSFDICINLSDPAKNGTYEPYRKTVTQLNLDSFQVRDSQGNVTTIEGGLKSAGSVYDEIVGNKYIKRVGEVHLGELTWITQEGYTDVFQSTNSIRSQTGNAVCSKYTVKVTDGYLVDKEVLISNVIYIKDSTYNNQSATSFKAAMSGVMLYYELATPIEYELVTVPDYTYPVDGNGTERRLPEDTASSVHAPFRADILYALNGSATLRNLDANYVRNDNIKQDTGNNENTVMSQAAVTRELGILSQRIAMTDLSFIDPQTGVGLFTRNTANTYVVRAAGNYIFPLVYGNAVKNGKPNPAAYTRIVSDYTAEFVNHLGNPITSPFIERNAGCNPFSATLLWQTGTGLIPSVSLVQGADCLYIRFSVASIPSGNGLACLAVKDVNGDVMWSWNIWLTTDDLSPEKLVNYTGVEYEMMPEALGTIWSDRTNKLGYNPFFQWGRKDAVGLPAAYNDGTMHALYDINGNSVTLSTYGVANDSDQGGTTRTVPYAIKHPELFFLYYNTTTYNWNNLSWMNNFWNAAETESSELADNQMTAIKTIYDPCPAGFMLPAGRAWTGFTTTGTNSGTASEFNVVGSFDAGWKFKKDAQDAVGVPYPASGYRDGGDGVQYSVGSGGYYWSFAPYSQANARNLGFYSGGVYPLDGSYRALGFSVRPSVELT